jgi:hypothetical protein
MGVAAHDERTHAYFGAPLVGTQLAQISHWHLPALAGGLEKP